MWLDRTFHSIACALVLASLASAASEASVLTLPPTLATEALSESVPTAFAPTNFSVEDYVIDWQGDAPAGVEASLESRSLEWVRVSEVLVIPRARLKIRASLPGEEPERSQGVIRCAGYSQPLSLIAGTDGAGTGDKTADRIGDSHVFQATIPVALISDPLNSCTLTLPGKDGKPVRHVFFPRFKALIVEPRVFVDPSCSKHKLKAVAAEAPQSDWVYVGCRLVSSEGAEHRTSSLEVMVFWDGVGQAITMGDVAVPATGVSVWPLRLGPEPGEIKLQGGARTLTLDYTVPEYLHRGGFSAGVGPYAFNFQSTTHSESTVTPIATLYGNYMIQDATRIVAFGAAAFNDTFYMDLGAYLSLDYAKILDRRIAVSLMLGAHTIGFSSGSQYYLRFGAPQGIEVVVSDFIAPGNSLHAGAFVYPNINGTEYYNSWLRFDRSGFFLEANFISWQENLEEKGLFYSRAVGLTVGFPLFQFL